LLPESAGLPKGNILAISNTSAAAPIAPPDVAVSSPSHRTTRQAGHKPFHRLGNAPADRDPCGQPNRPKIGGHILLRPGTSYVQRFNLDEVYPKVGPGKYFFTTKYVAYFAAKGCKRWTEDDIDKFPFRPWYGTTAANDVSFEILPNPKTK
jgi:hypothetical protein